MAFSRRCAMHRPRPVASFDTPFPGSPVHPAMNEDKAARYHRLQRRVSVASVAWSIALLVLLLWSGGSGWLRDVSMAAATVVFGPDRVPGPAVLIYVLALMALHAIGD